MNSFFNAIERAKGLKQQDPNAVAAWLEALGHWHIDEAEYREWSFQLHDTLRAQNHFRSAGWVDEYLGRHESAQKNYAKANAGPDLARLHALAENHQKSSEAYEEAEGFVFHAAHQAFLGEEYERACQLLLRWMGQNGKKHSRFHRGTVLTCLGLVYDTLENPKQAARHYSEANQLLEEHAAQLEKRGQRKQASVVYRSILNLGRVSRSNESLLEGGINQIRIAKENHERFNVIKNYCNLIEHSEGAQEWRVAAELYEEAGEYAKRVAFIYGDWFWVQAGQAWVKVARAHLEQSAPLDLVESSLISAANGFNRAKDTKGLLASYRILASLDLSNSRKEKYHRILARLKETEGSPESSVALPDHFRRSFEPQFSIWQNLLEFDLKAKPHLAIARLLHKQDNRSQVQRRRAMHFLVNRAFADAPLGHLSFEEISNLTQINHPLTWPAVAHLWAHGTVENQLALLSETAQHSKLSESLELIVAGLNSESDPIQTAAAKALADVRFPQAFEALVDLANSDDRTKVKKGCYVSLAKIGTDAATEFLLDVMRTEAGDVSDFVQQVLFEHPQERMLSALDRNLKLEPTPAMRTQISSLADNIRKGRVRS